MSDDRSQGHEFLHGTLELLVLRVLEGGAENGYAIARSIEDRSGKALSVEEGSLYPALYRMERRGWITSRWGKSENNRRAKFYRISALGARQLRSRSEAWQDFSSGVARVLEERS